MSDIAIEPVPETLWDLAVWRARAETLLVVWHALEPGSAPEEPQAEELALLLRARRAFSWRQRQQTQDLGQQLQQQAHRPDPEVESLMDDWRQLNFWQRLETFLWARRQNNARLAADRRARKAWTRAQREISALLNRWRRLSYEDRLESYYYLRDLNDAREAAAKAELAASPEARS